MVCVILRIVHVIMANTGSLTPTVAVILSISPVITASVPVIMREAPVISAGDAVKTAKPGGLWVKGERAPAAASNHKKTTA
jgi:hypothetical protein